MKFVGMKSIPKKDQWGPERWTDWVATEKVHGSSYQFFTDDGLTVGSASRRYVLSEKNSFLKCPVKDFRERHEDMVKSVYQKIMSEDRWAPYRAENKEKNIDDDDDEDGENEEEGEEDGQEEQPEGAGTAADVGDDGATKEDRLKPEVEDDSDKKVEENVEAGAGVGDDDGVQKDIVVDGEGRRKASEVETNEDIDQRRSEEAGAEQKVELRIYGELYGGGGVEKDVKPAVQKEIIYADEFRFYVFAMSVNRRWLSLTEMNEMCAHAGFPYYAQPVCEPKATVEELKTFLLDSGFMHTRSRLTEKQGDHKTFIEGVVMSPLTRPGYGLPAIKFLAPAFNDVRMVGKAKKELRPNYCTKARYMSVISKLDIPERENAEMVTEMFINDILKESGETELSNNKTKAYTKCVRMWLSKDGYIQDDAAAAQGNAQGKKKNKGKKGKNEGQEEIRGREGEKGQEVKAEQDGGDVAGGNDDDDDEDGFAGGLFG